MDRISAMRAFVRVIEAGSFTKAAETMGIPKPTVTRMVQWLESELQVQLIHRTTRSLTLTPTGATYFDRTVRLIADLDDLEFSARKSLVKPTGTIRVEVSVSVGTIVLIPALPDFFGRYPDIDVDLGLGNREVHMVAEGVDCAIRLGSVKDHAPVARRVDDLGFTTCATPAYLEEHGFPVHPEDLQQGHRVIGVASRRAAAPRPFAFTRDGARIELEVAHRMLVNDTNAYTAAGLAGLGVVQAPTLAVRAPIRDGRLVHVLPDWQADTAPMSIVYPASRYLSSTVRVFIDWAVALFEEDPDLRRR